VTIGIAARSDIFLSDVQTYRQMFNLPVNDPNFINTGDDAGVVIGDDSETDLDTEISGGIAPNATVDVVIGPSNWLVDGVTLSEMYMVEQNVADIISISYSTCESSEGAGGNSFNNQLFEQAAAQGISVFVAAGDSGSAECDGDQPFETGGYATNGESSTWYSVAVAAPSSMKPAAATGPRTTAPRSSRPRRTFPNCRGTKRAVPMKILPTTPDSPRRNRTVYTLRSGTGCRTIAWRVCGLAQAVRARTTATTVADRIGRTEYRPHPSGRQLDNLNLTNTNANGASGAGYTAVPTVTLAGETCTIAPSSSSTQNDGSIAIVNVALGDDVTSADNGSVTAIV